MNEPKRLLFDLEAPLFDRDLLRAWADERPAPAARDRALGLAAVAASAAMAANVGIGIAGGSLAPKALATGLSLKALLAVAVLITGAVGAGAYLASPAKEPAFTRAVPFVPPAAHGDLRISTTPAATPQDVTSLPPAGPGTSRSHELRDPLATMADQIASMDRARAALAGGDAAGALRMIDDYEHKYPRGTFVEEAEALRVDALVHRGDAAGARRIADRFLAAHPSSPHAARVRALVGAP